MAFPRWLTPRFSLRTLLIAIAIISLGCWLVNRAVHLHEALERVRDLEGKITFDYQLQENGAPSGPAWLREWLSEAFFNDVVQVAYPVGASGNPQAGLGNIVTLPIGGPPTILARSANEQVRWLGPFTRLESLTIHGLDWNTDELSDLSAAWIGRLRHLKVLQLENCCLTEQALKNISELPELEQLDLQNIQIVGEFSPESSHGVSGEPSYPKLKNLTMKRVRLSDRGLLALLKQLPDLPRLDVSSTNVTKAGVEAAQARWKGKLISYYYPEGSPAAATQSH